MCIACVACSRTSLDDDSCFEPYCARSSEQDASIDDRPQDGLDASKSDDCSLNGCLDSSATGPDAQSDSSALDLAAAAPCLTGGNVFHFEGETGNSVFEGNITVGPQDAVWSAQRSGPVNFVSVKATTLSDIATAVPWLFALYAPFAQSPLSVGVYDPVVGASPTQATYPYLQLEAAGRFCEQSVAARVDILAMKVKVTDLTFFTATFEERCNGATPALRGCVHFER